MQGKACSLVLHHKGVRRFSNLLLVLSFFVYTQCLWKLTRAYSSQPSSKELLQCVTKLSELLGIAIHLTKSVAIILTRHAAFLCLKSKNIRGGRQREAYFQVAGF